MRKPVVLITGANGEIGHALVANLAEKQNQAVVALDVNALDPRIARLVHREITGSILDTSLLERVLAEYEVDLIFHLAALLSTRAEFTPMAAHHVNVEGTLKLLEFAARETESHGRPVVFVYPSSIAAYGLPSLEAQAQRRPRARRRVEQAGHDVRLQQALLRAPRPLLCEALQAAVGNPFAARRFPLRQVSGPHLSRHGSLGRDVRLRLGDDSRGRAGRAVRVLRPARCAHSVHGHARRHRRAAEAVGGVAVAPVVQRLQRAGVQPVGRGNPSICPARISPRRTSPIVSTPSARASSIHGQRTSTTARRAPTGTSRRRTTSIAPFTSI